MEIRKAGDPMAKPTVNMLIYGQPGTGKTTFAATGEHPVLVGDCENGASLLAARNINVDVATIEKWTDIEEFYKAVKDGGYKTVVLDPLGELLEKLIAHLKKQGYTSAKGDSLTLQGWGVAKDKFKAMMRVFRDLKVNFIAVAHSAESKDEDNILVRPKMQAHLDEEVCAMMDVVGYMRVIKQDKGSVRRLFVSPSEKFYAKDRSSLLGEALDNPSFSDIIKKITENPVFVRSKNIEIQIEKNLEEFNKDMEPKT